MANNVFAVPVFFIVFRETIEAAIIIAVLLAFLKKTLDGPNADVAVYKSLVKQIWLGAVLGFLLCLIVGGALIGTFYTVGSNAWSAAEYYYEGVFYLLAAVIISAMGVALLRIGKMQEKWRVKLAEALDASVQTGNARGRFKRFATKYSLFILSFITVSREGIEGVAFISGVSFSAPAKSIPLPVVTGLLAGSFVGWVMYKGGSLAKLRIFLTASTCLLYLVAAGLVARSVWYFEAQHWKILVGGDAAEMGSGPGSYDIDRSVWHVNCCSPDVNGGGGWGIFNGIFGWTNSATYSTVISYNVYWILVIVTLVAMRFHEVNGHWPLLKPRRVEDGDSSDANAAGEVVLVEAGGNDSGDLRTNDKKMD